MPSVLPSTAYFYISTIGGGGSLGSAAYAAAGKGRIARTIDVLSPPFGSAYARTALRGGSVGVAPAGVTFLDVTADTASIENAAAVGWPISHAESFASLSIFVEQFAPTGEFISMRRGPETVVFDANIPFAGVHIRADERHTRVAAFHMPVTPGQEYRVGLDSIQYVAAYNSAYARSDFTYDFGPLFFVFS
jgi:hypothetical protein